MQFQNLHTFSDLQEQFGPMVAENGSIARAAIDIVGQFYRDVVAETAEIVSHQWLSGIRRSAVKGFLFAGPPGVGKTTVARRVAYELCHRFRDASVSEADDSVVLVLIDGGEIARARYGESEERIREVFNRAEKGFTHPNQRAVLLFDDVESILMKRGSDHAKEWHFSQDSVFFHSIDDLDTSRTTVFLTSNRPDLVDEAIVDRFLCYAFAIPSADLLAEVAVRRAQDQHLTSDQIARLSARVRASAQDGTLWSIRQAERLVVRQYVEDVLGRPSAALVGAELRGAPEEVAALDGVSS